MKVVLLAVAIFLLCGIAYSYADEEFDTNLANLITKESKKKCVAGITVDMGWRGGAEWWAVPCEDSRFMVVAIFDNGQKQVMTCDDFEFIMGEHCYEPFSDQKKE